MANILEGNLTAEGLKFGIVVARFNEFITTKLLGGALDTLHRHGAKDEDVDAAWVPGAFKSRWQPRKWRRAANTTQSSAWVR